MELPFAFWKDERATSPYVASAVDTLEYIGTQTTASFTVRNPRSESVTIVWSASPNPPWNTPSNTTLAAGQTKTVNVTRALSPTTDGTLNGTWTGTPSGETGAVEGVSGSSPMLNLNIN